MSNDKKKELHSFWSGKINSEVWIELTNIFAELIKGDEKLKDILNKLMYDPEIVNGKAITRYSIYRYLVQEAVKTCQETGEIDFLDLVLREISF